MTVFRRLSIVPTLDGRIIARDMDDGPNQQERSFEVVLRGAATYCNAADGALETERASIRIVEADPMITLVVGKGVLRPRLRLLEKVPGLHQDLFRSQCGLLFADPHPEWMQVGNQELWIFPIAYRHNGAKRQCPTSIKEFGPFLTSGMIGFCSMSGS